VGDTLVIAYLASIKPEADSLPRESELHLLRWSPDGTRHDQVLKRFPIRAAFDLGPRLRAGVDGRIHLLCCMAGSARGWSIGTGMPLGSKGLLGQLLYWRSEDSGRSWSLGVPLPLEGEESIGEWGSVGSLGSRVPDIDLLPMPARVDVAVAMGSLVAFHSTDGTTWQGPDTLDRKGIPEGRPVLQPAMGNHAPTVAWISERFKRSTDSPLSGSMPWRNNDVLVASMSSSKGRIAETAMRITPDLSYADCLRCRSAGDTLLCIWTGYARVSETLPHGYDPSHSLSFAAIPLDAIARYESGTR
jgi:hypothetical protein